MKLIEELLKVKGRPNNVIFAAAGKRRMGKTSLLSLFGYMAYRCGIKVASNYHLNFPYEYIKTPKDFKNCSNCLALLDDFNRWASSRITKNKKTELFADIIDNSGKRGVSLGYSTKYMMQIRKEIRHETDYVIYPHPVYAGTTVIKIGYSLHNFAVDNVDPRPIEENKLPAAPIFSLYDTREEIRVLK